MPSKVPSGLYWSTRFVCATAPLWERLGRLESSILADDLEEISIIKPVYVCGLARSGTTILTEFLNEHTDLTSLRYSDFPWLYTPFWRNWLRQRSRTFEPKPTERAHQDRIMVTEDSPEAYEEPLWIHFNKHIHDTAHSQVLDENFSNPEFERFYQNHLKKLLLVRNARRYLAKGNYNLTRMAYLQARYPDARFVVPVRHPINHIASLRKQHSAFINANEADSRIQFQLSASGHFEFGPARATINVGNPKEVKAINAAWAQGREVEGWARHWAMIYGFVHDVVQSAPMREAVKIVRYEDLCGNSLPILQDIVTHCDLPLTEDSNWLQTYDKRLTLPEYYNPDFSSEELSVIDSLTGEVARKFDYAPKLT